MNQYSQAIKKTILPFQYGLETNKYLKYFLIFLGWPAINLGFSLSVYFFLLFIYHLKRKTKISYFNLNYYSYKFYLFGLISLISLLFSPWDSLKFKAIPEIQLQIQYFYWVLVSIIFMNLYMKMDKIEFSKFILIGVILHTIHFFFFSYGYESESSFFRTFMSRNGYVYTILCLWPIATIYVYNKYGLLKGNLSLLVVLFLMLFTDGRAAIIIILIETIFIYSIYNKTNAKIVRLVLFVLIPFFFILSNLVLTENNKQSIGDAVSPISSRIGDFIKGEGVDGDLSTDKSWLTRKLMIEKGFEIIEKYPFFGVGIGHFNKYNAELKNVFSDDYTRLIGDNSNNEADEYNRTSAHNSYIHVLAEMGIVGFIVLLMILLPLLTFSLIRLFNLKLEIEDMALISIFGMCIHFYTISSFPGTLTWFVFGLASNRKNFYSK